MSTYLHTTHPDDLLQIADLNAAELHHLLLLADRMKEEPDGWRETHTGKLLACYVTKPSTRTRVSLEAAAYRLGMLPLMLRPDELQLGRGEPISDTARVLASYADAIAIRTYSQLDLEAVARAANVPVINALTDGHHPCQALADLLTLRERFGDLRGLKLAYVGDGNNVAHSLMQAGALAGIHIAVAAPHGFKPGAGILSHAEEVAAAHGGEVEVVTDPHEAVRAADAVYTDVWVSMGQDDERAERLAHLSGYAVTAQLMAYAKAEAVFMHCLPAHRGEEVAAEVIDGPQSVVFQQAENRLYTEQAVIHALIARDWGE